MARQWDLPGSTGVCAATGQALAPGASYWTAVTVEEGAFVRRDYAQAAWNDELREQAFWCWRGRMPDPDAPAGPRLASDEVILDFFHRLAESTAPEHRSFRYVLGLLLVRRKLLKLSDIVRKEGEEVLILKEKGSGTEHKVEAPTLTPAALEEVRNQIQQILDLGGEEAQGAADHHAAT